MYKTRIKTFIGQSGAIDSEVNAWLPQIQNPNIYIRDIKMATTINYKDGTQLVVITVFYQEWIS